MKSNESGFTLIELLVVIAIVGILSAISFPSLLNQINKARLSEALTYAGSFNRSQQAYFLENGTFADTFPKLGIGVPAVTDSYTYSIDAQASGTAVTFTATPTNPTINGVASKVFVEGGATPSVICQDIPGQVPEMATVETVAQCPN